MSAPSEAAEKPVIPVARPGSEVKGDYNDGDNVIRARTLVSATLGDLRRTSFITSAAARALDLYGVSTMSIFKGGTTKLFSANYW